MGTENIFVSSRDKTKLFQNIVYIIFAFYKTLFCVSYYLYDILA